mgnify:CR=1 FL=1|jgi:hypothetical protein
MNNSITMKDISATKTVNLGSLDCAIIIKAISGLQVDSNNPDQDLITKRLKYINAELINLNRRSK